MNWSSLVITQIASDKDTFHRKNCLTLLSTIHLKAPYIFLQSTHGFLNQSEGLEELLTCVLHEGIMEGWCRVHADNLYIMGQSMEKNCRAMADSARQDNEKQLETISKKELLFLRPTRFTGLD